MLDLFHLVPRKAGGVFNRLLDLGSGVAMRDDVEPVKVRAIFGDALFIR